MGLIQDQGASKRCGMAGSGSATGVFLIGVVVMQENRVSERVLKMFAAADLS